MSTHLQQFSKCSCRCTTLPYTERILLQTFHLREVRQFFVLVSFFTFFGKPVVCPSFFSLGLSILYQLCSPLYICTTSCYRQRVYSRFLGLHPHPPPPPHPHPHPDPHLHGFIIIMSAATSNKTFQFKLVLLGDSAVGKSSLVLRFVKGQFFEYQESTIGGKTDSPSPSPSPLLWFQFTDSLCVYVSFGHSRFLNTNSCCSRLYCQV